MGELALSELSMGDLSGHGGTLIQKSYILIGLRCARCVPPPKKGRIVEITPDRTQFIMIILFRNSIQAQRI